jgi:hypothetical protein
MHGQMTIYRALADLVVALHAVFIVWIIFGAFLTRHRPLLRALHIASVVWGVLIELFPWPCPLTLAENWLQVRTGKAGYQSGFLLHYLDKLVYPDLPSRLLVVAAILVGLINIVIYIRRGIAGAAQAAK